MPGSACCEIFYVNDYLIYPESCQVISTDIGLVIPNGYFGKIYTRSSWAKKYTCVEGAVIDSDCRGKIYVIFHNHSVNWLNISKGQSVAQICFHKKEPIRFKDVFDFEYNTQCGEGCFGSTNKKMTFYANKYIPKYNDINLKWYEKDYDWIDVAKYEQFERNRHEYIKNVKIINFDIIYSELGVKPLDNSLKYYQTIRKEDF